MNKAITHGAQLMPPAFADGLNNWSSGDGTPGSDSYDGAANAAFVPSDADFGGCLEIQKTAATQKLRCFSQTPLEPGCYLQVTARIKAISGSLPVARIAAWAAEAGGGHLNGVVETGPGVALASYGEVVEVTAIVGTGARGGVDMNWGRSAAYGHFGIDLTGASGGIIRVEDISITDITSAYLRDMLSLVDVTDFGAVGDGITDNSTAFEAADSAAEGRRILVPTGVFHLGSSLSLGHETLFEGTVTMPDAAMLLLTRNFDFPSYAAAFGNEELAFKKAFQALLNNSDHESLDLCGRKIAVSAPIDMQAAVPNRDSYATRRVIRNGQLDAQSAAAWDDTVVTSQATYDPGNSRTLSNVANIANVPVGALVEGSGTGREIYVRSKDTGAGELTLSAPLFDAAGTQVFTFREFKYLLDFSGFSDLKKFGMEQVDVQCNGRCSAIRLSPAGKAYRFEHCFISRPKDRGITSHGEGCAGLLVDHCQFLSAEESEDVPDRTSIALNANANDVKLRNCRAFDFRHWAVLSGSNATITGNHFFQGDSLPDGIRTAGLVIAINHCSTTISDNYIDNCFVEWTNEHSPEPDFSGGFSFSALSVSDNVFLSGDVAPWFSYLVVKPHGSGHYLNGLSVCGNKFRSVLGSIDRAERVDTSFADLDFSRTKNVFYEGNTYHNVSAQPSNPLRVRHTQNSAASTWVIDPDGGLPFGGSSRGVDGITAIGPVTSGAAARHIMPYAELGQGSGNDQIHLVWGEAVQGEVQVTMRMDK
jgi:hypothetical protein